MSRDQKFDTENEFIGFVRSNSVWNEETSKNLKKQSKNTVFLQFFEGYSILTKFERTKLIFSFFVLNFWSLDIVLMEIILEQTKFKSKKLSNSF